jgi:hypothetical protein
LQLKDILQMKNQDKTPVIAILNDGENPKKQFNELLSAFMRHPLAPAGPSRYYNTAGYSKERLDQLVYDAKKLFGITDKEVREAPQVKEIEVTDAQTVQSAPLQTLLACDDVSALDYHKELKPLAAALSSERRDELVSWKKADLVEYLNGIKQAAVDAGLAEATKVAEAATDEVKSGWKLREEYPFLGDEDCPDKIKILVNDMITAHENYVEGRQSLRELKESDPQLLDELTAKTVENFELNKEIKAELDYYKEHKEILGNHPIFAEEMLQKKVDSYKDVELASKLANLRSYVSKDKKKLESAKDEASKNAIQAKLDEWQAEIDLIEKRLDDAKK